MEFASKLSSLTELHLFLMLENRGRREVCGSTRLTDSYAKGGLRPCRNDVLVDVESQRQCGLNTVVDDGGDDRAAVVLDDDDDFESDHFVNPLAKLACVFETEDVKPNLKRRSLALMRESGTTSPTKRSGGVAEGSSGPEKKIRRNVVDSDFDDDDGDSV